MKITMLQMRNLIQFIFALLVFSTGYVGWQSHHESIKSSQTYNSLITTQTELLINIQKVTSKSSTVQRFVLRALLEPDPQQISVWREKIQVEREGIKKPLEEIQQEIDQWENQGIQQKFKELTQVRSVYIESSEKVLKLCQEGKNSEARDFNNRENLLNFNRYQGLLEEIDAEIASYSREINSKTFQEVHQSTERIYYLAILATVVGIIGSILTAFVMRGVVQRVYRSSEEIEQSSQQTASASAQVSAASHSLANSASEQAATLEETSASMEEMSSMIKQNAESAKQARQLSGEAHSLTDGGVRQMEELKLAMHEIQEAGTLISKIIKTINEIAFQTNILALNASVEAARAGEHGLGFAVVAEEVRNLALRASNAADDTASKIEASIQKSQLGVEISTNLALSLGKIDGKSKEIDQLINSIASASEEQSRGIDQLNIAIRQIDNVTQGIASSAEETASSSEELKAQSQSMLEQVEELHGIVGAKNSVAPVSQVSVTTPEPRPRVKRAIESRPSVAQIPLPPQPAQISGGALKRPSSLNQEDFFSDDHDRK